MTTRPLRLLALAAVLVWAASAAAVPITFQVRMGQQITLGLFDPDTESVDVAGSFNDWGTNPLTPLADADGDSVYVVEVDGFTPGETIEYKFRIDGLWDGREEFPGVGSNRVYTVLESGNLIDVWYNDFPPGDATGEVGETHWWNDAVFYEIFVRSFHDSDGDGVGDLQGLTSKLDYLNDGDPNTTDDLGVTGIWLMPINDSPSYHGYDAVDYLSINPDYGTMADFEAFLAAAHARGIKVIVDFVMNHCSDQHPWFVASAAEDPTYRDWFRWENHNPHETGPWGQDLWHWDESGWYYGLFYGGMPDLNYDTPAVKTWMFDAATYWLQDVGVDGFRLDAVLYIDEDDGQYQTTPGTLQFWQDYNAHVKSVNPDMLSVGEAWTNTSTVVQYVEEDRLDLCFEFDLSYAMLNAVNGADVGYLGGKAAQVAVQYPYLQYATFLTNHDQDRCMSVLGEDEGRARSAAGLYLTLPGVPFLYYGEEIGLTGTGDHLNIRTPMHWSDASEAGFTTGTPWHPVNADYPDKNVADLEQDPGSLLEWYKTLIHVRNGAPALRHGTFDLLGSSASEILAFVRSDGGQHLLCLVNTSSTAQGAITLTGTASSLPPGDYEATNLINPLDVRTLTVTAESTIENLSLAAHATAVFELPLVTAVDPDGDTPPRTGLRLEPNRPNPFNPTTTIRYALPERTHVKLAVYDLAGREVARLRDGMEDEGEREARWDGLDGSGRSVGAGVYVLRLDAGDDTRLTKMTLVK